MIAGATLPCIAVHEREHKIIKRWAVPMCMTRQRSYERSLLLDCTRTHMQSLKEPLLKPCVLAGCRTSMSGSGGCIAGIWLRIG